MAETPRMLWAYPDDNDRNWYGKFSTLTNAQDAAAYAGREDRSFLIGGGGTVSFNSGSGVLTWSSAIECFSPITGFKGTVAAGSSTILNGEILYVTLTRGMTANVTLTAQVATSIPNSDNAIALAVRSGNTVYFRNGARLVNGSSVELYSGASSGQKDHSGFTGSELKTVTFGQQTTGDGATSVYTLAVADNTAVSVEITVVARSSTNRALFSKKALVYRAGGVATLQGSVADLHADIKSAGASAWTSTVDVDGGNNLVVEVDGDAATTINWVGTVRTQAVASNT